MLIYTCTKSRKKTHNTKKKQELNESWNQLLKKWDVKDTKSVRKQYSGLDVSHVRSTRHIPSLDTGTGNAVKKQQNQYTGTAMIGVATLHKSNAVPVFSEDDAKDIARMRR